MRRPLLLVVIAAGCGRLGFAPAADELAGDAAPDDAAVTGGAPDDGIIATTTWLDGGSASCSALPPICGPLGTQSCCDSPLVVGGTYSRSYDISGDGQFSSPVLMATVSDFQLDKYEVTVNRFRQFVAAGQGTQVMPPAPGAGAHSEIADSGWDPTWNSSLAATTAQLLAGFQCDGAFSMWTDIPGGHEPRPMNCVSWFEAAAFCAWDGGFLPSEAQWNYAATAGIEQRAYPWSTPASSLSIDDSRTSYFVDPTQQCHGDGLDGCAPGDILPVGTRPAGDGKWGHSDLGGNVLEWTLDWFADPYPQSRCADCANLTPAMGRVIRGGGFDTVERLHRAGRRLELSPAARQSDAGFRCARAPRTHP